MKKVLYLLALFSSAIIILTASTDPALSLLPKSVAVFCASSDKIDAAYIDAAKQLGRVCAINDIKIIFGGANTGLMGAMADEALKEGGKLEGILPEAGRGWNVGHAGIQELRYVNGMYERYKAFDNAEAFVILPGGIGTLSETTNIIAQKQYGIHKKPIIFVNVNGFFDKLLEFLNFTVQKNTMKAEHLKLFMVISSPEQLLPALQSKSEGFLDHASEWWKK